MSTPSSATFTPKALVSITIGRQYVNLYPVVDNTMGAHERAYAFHVNKTNLAALLITPRQMLTALAHQIGQDTSIQGDISDFLHRFSTVWCDFSKLTVVSFHDSVGEHIPDTTTVADPAILLPVQNGAVITCRALDVRFVYVRADIDYSDKIASGVCTFRTEYFIELPQATYNMTDDTVSSIARWAP